MGNTTPCSYCQGEACYKCNAYMPNPNPCYNCDGKGKYDIKCQSCENKNNENNESQYCYTCCNTGYIREIKCVECDGTGDGKK